MKHIIRDKQSSEKKDFNKRCRQLILENEAKAIVIVGKLELVFAGVYLVAGFLNLAGLLSTATPVVYLSLFIPGIIMIILAFMALGKKFKSKNIRWLKYVSLFMMTLSVWIVNIVIGYKVWLLYAVPILFSIRFYNRRFTLCVTGFSILLGIASAFTNAYLAPYIRVMDLNLVSFNEPGTLSYYSWLHNAVLNHGYDPQTLVSNGFRLSILPNLAIYFLIIFASNSVIKNALRMLMQESESHEREIQKLNVSLGKITLGDLSVKSDILDTREISNMSDDFYEVVDNLKELISSAENRMAEDMEVAKTIQLSVLPSTFPPYPGHNEFDIYACTFPAKEVGGDFYDLYLLGDNRLVFLIADVSGKGIPAAMFMMNAKSIIKGLAEGGLNVDEVFTKANEKLCESNEAEMFVTAWMGILDLNTGNVQYASAGHNPPLVRHRDGNFEYLNSRAGFVLAGMEGMKYRINEMQFSPGDEIYLYTDGVTEAVSSERRMFKEERLLSLLNEKPYERAFDVCNAVKTAVDAFMGDEPQFDDITMLSLKYSGKKHSARLLQVPAKLNYVTDIKNLVKEELDKTSCDKRTFKHIITAVDEIFTNIASYAYPESEGMVMVHFAVEDGTASLTFEDNGVQFNPLEVKEPDITLDSDERGIGGFGIYMVRKTMDSVTYEYTEGKNILRIKKKI